MASTHIDIGSGDTKVLVLHGWFGDAQSWHPVFDLLDRDMFSYCFMDYRGYGDSMQARGEFTLDEIAADALALAGGLGWSRFSVVGHSMGGAAAQLVLASAADRVDKLVGVSPVPASGVPFDDQSWALFSGAAEEPANRRAIIDLTTGNRLTDRWLDAMVQYSLDRSTREAFAVLPCYPNGQCETFADAGHYAMNETPVQLVTSMEAFLRP